MEYEKIIHAIIDPLIEHKDAVLIREISNEGDKSMTILIATEKEDISRLIGRKGIIANSIRELISVAAKKESKHIHIRFESFEDEGKEE